MECGQLPKSFINAAWYDAKTQAKLQCLCCAGFFYTAVYMVLTPASWVFTVIIPLIYSLIIFDKPFVSPVVFALLMASPFKFVPYCPVPLVW